MKRTILRSATVFALAWLALAGCFAPAALAQVGTTVPPDAPGDEEGIETLTHGPIHEAFANPTDLEPTPVPAATKEPPPLVPEEPPEYMPEGAIWIPGYWLWDDDRDDYLWVTGVARVPPPDMKWVPGYYTEVDGAWQRVSGFWVSSEVPKVEYRVQSPPQSLEVGPSSPAPADNYFWVPGNWAYYDTDYRWQAGYWAPYQANWIWAPARWVWTPAGYVFCPGFWDYRMAYRGQIFATVYFQRPIYTRPQWQYRPWCVIPTNNLFIHLWLRPRWNCYYFGNYYAPQYANMGFVPWANISVVSRQRYIYDPFFAYARVHYHQQGINYIDRVQGWHRYFADHNDLRPPRTWRQQQQLLARAGHTRIATQLIAEPVKEIAHRGDSPLRIHQLDAQARRAQEQGAERLREFHTQRRKVELADARLEGRRDADGARGREDGKKGKGDRADAGKNGKAGDQADRGVPSLTIPKDLPGGGHHVARGGQGEKGKVGVGKAGEGKRGEGKLGDRAGDDDKTPPPTPRPGRVAIDAGKAGRDKAGRDKAGRDTEGRDDDRGAKSKVDQAPSRDETPPVGRTADSPATGADDRDQRGKGAAGRGLGNLGRADADDDRGGRPGRDLPGVDRSPAIERQKGVAKGKAGGRGGDAAGVDSDRGPVLGDGRGKADAAIDRTLPKVDRPGRGAEIPSVDTPSRGSKSSERVPRVGGAEVGRSPARPDAGLSPPAGTITPPIINPNRLPGRGNVELPGGRTEAPRATVPGNPGRGRIEQPSAGGRGDAGNRPAFTLPRSSAGEGNRSPLVPKASPSTPRIDNTPRTSPGRGNAPENRGRNPAKSAPGRSDTSSAGINAFRSSLDREPPARAPRMEARAVPRAEAPRENRAPPRSETSRPSRSEAGPAGSRGHHEPRAERGKPDAGPAAEVASSSDRGRGKGKGKRDE